MIDVFNNRSISHMATKLKKYKELNIYILTKNSL